MKTWEEIRDEAAGMLANGKLLEDIISRLEEYKNEMAKAELIAVFDELKKPKLMTNEEYIRTAPTTDDIVAELRKMDTWIKKKMKEEIGSYNNFVSGYYYRDWLKQPHREE